MCIRDSCGIGGEGGRSGKEFVEDAPECVEIGFGSDGRLAGNSVSYTHLRAHETVLDLVCRLLLEKKKKIIINIYKLKYHHRSTAHY